MLNKTPLNSSPLNAGSTGAAEPEEPIIIGPSGPIDPENPPPQPGEGIPGGHVWSVTVSGHAANLTGVVSVQHPDQGNAVAEFSYKGGLPGVGGGVSISFNGSLRFTGIVEQADYDSESGVTTVRATTDLQASISAMSKDQVAGLIGGIWSEDVFGPLDERDSWQYAQELLTTRPVALGVGRDGQPRVVPLIASGGGSSFAGGAIDGTPTSSVMTPDAGITGVIVEIDYRYSYNLQFSQSYTWTSVSGRGTNGFEQYHYNRAHQLPDMGMLTQAIAGTGWKLGSLQTTKLPASIPSIGWINNLSLDLLLSADFTLRTRWTQRRVETYRLTVGSTAGRTETIRCVIDVPEADEEGWASFRDNRSGARRDQARLDLAAAVLAAQAVVKVGAAKVTGRSSWQAPLAYCTGISGGAASDGGTAVMVTDEIDIETGSAICTITTEQRTATSVSPPALPPAPTFPSYPAAAGMVTLGNQMAGLGTTPESYDDQMQGFAGNYTLPLGNGVFSAYPRRFAFETPEIPAEWRDELVREVDA